MSLYWRSIELWRLPNGIIMGMDDGKLKWANEPLKPDRDETEGQRLWVIPSTMGRVTFMSNGETVDVQKQVLYTRHGNFVVECAYAPLNRAWIIRGQPEPIDKS